MSRGLLISRNEKLRLFSLSKSNPTPYNTLTYKTYRNIFNSAIRTAKKLHYEKLFCKAKFNLKQTWTLFNKAINKKPQKNEQNITSLKLNDLIITDTKLMAEAFNNFYLSIATDIVESINPPPSPS